MIPRFQESNDNQSRESDRRQKRRLDNCGQSQRLISLRCQRVEKATRPFSEQAMEGLNLFVFQLSWEFKLKKGHDIFFGATFTNLQSEA